MRYLVALRKESVDRNIGVGTTRDRRGVVALRKESVDRNLVHGGFQGAGFGSLSARRAWIEMGNLFCRALQKKRRSPQGERG